MKRKILIDGRFIGVGDSIGRVTFGILEHLLKIDSDHEYSLLIRPAGIKQVKERGLWDDERVKVEVLDIAHYSLEEQSKLLIWLNKKPYDLVYFTQFNHPVLYRKPYIIIIHDLTTFGYFRYENPLKVALFKKVMKSAVHDSKKVITTAKVTKAELLETYKVAKDKIEVVHLGIDANYMRLSKLGVADRVKLGNRFKQYYDLSADYLLYTGMWKRHKNLPRLLAAFQSVHNSSNEKVSGLQLVLVGKIDKNEPVVIERIEKINGHSIDKAVPTDAVFVTGFVSEELLPAAYAGALAYVTPSLNEGFGLPPLEAMSCGIPVIASNVSATPEILGDAAVYFDPYNPDNIADKIKQVVPDLRKRLDLQKKGLERVKLYRWEDNAEKTLKIINGIIGKG